MLSRWIAQSERLNQLASYHYVAYQCLQIIGYRLVGMRCRYRWGQYRPEPVGSAGRAQHYFASTFPAAVCLLFLMVQLVLTYCISKQLHLSESPWLFFVFLVQPIPFSTFGAYTIFDFLRLRRLLKDTSEQPGTG